MILEVHVQPGARRSEFAGQHGERIKIRLAARAVDNQANEALVDFLAEHYGVPKSRVRRSSDEAPATCVIPSSLTQPFDPNT